MITQERLKELFHFCPDTGLFTRITTTSNRSKAGSIAGSKGVSGYLQININHKIYKSHRLAWLYVYGVLPSLQIDHIDHDRANNIITNLRLVTHQENSKNQKIRSTNSSGFTGVFWYKRHNKWLASIKVNGKAKYLGLYKALSDAVLVRLDAEKEYGYHVNHGVK